MNDFEISIDDLNLFYILYSLYSTNTSNTFNTFWKGVERNRSQDNSLSENRIDEHELNETRRNL